MSPTVYLVEHDAAVRDALATLLRADGLSVEAYGSAEQFLAAGEPAAGCLVADARLSGLSGLHLLRRLKAGSSPLPVVIVSASLDPSLQATATRLGAVAFLDKPFSPEAFIAAVRRALTPAAAVAKTSRFWPRRRVRAAVARWVCGSRFASRCAMNSPAAEAETLRLGASRADRQVRLRNST